MKARARFFRFRNIAKNISNSQRILGLVYVYLLKRCKVDKTVVLLESHHGADFIGNPYYIAKHLLTHPQFRNLKVIVVCPRKARKRVKQAFSSAGYRFCTNRSIFYAYYLATAGFLVNDVTFPIYFSRRKEQKYLNTWHGTPLKSLGRRCRNDLFLFISNTQRNFLHATHLLAPNRHTENVLLQDYMIEKFWNGAIIRCGYPRNDILVNKTNESKNSILQVVFMPTWRGGLTTVDEASQIQIRQLQDLLDEIDSSLDKTTVFWVRLHPLVRGQVELSKYNHVRAFPADLEPYEHLASCDALVTDYSSVLFDFACTGKPIILYTSDMEQYQEERDFCIDPATLPFEQVTTVEQLLGRIQVLGESKREESSSYQHFQDEYCKHDQGTSTQLVCDLFFLQGSDVEIRNVRPDPSRLKVLLFGGSFLNNGITSSLKALLSKLELSEIDLILWVSADTARPNGESWFSSLHNQLSFIPTRNWLAVDPIDAVRIAAKDVFSRSWKSDDPFATSVWQREWRRHFGSAEFDTVVHFTGYERSVSLLLQGVNAHKVVYIHSDMAREIETGRVGDPRSMRLAFELANRIATVREGAEKSYCEEIFDISKKVIYVPNTLNLNCRQRSTEPLLTALRDDTVVDTQVAVENSLARPSEHRFINLARFSPEKGQVRLIAAFERVWANHPSVQLFIVGAHGKSYTQVTERAARSTAASAIFVLHGSGNPFPLVARMDTLVFSSFYEGIGLVIFEAFSLGLNVVSTDIPGPSELLNQGYGLAVENSEDGLVEGMKAAIRGEVPRKTFDFEAHNEFAVDQFMKAITPENFPMNKVEHSVN